MSMTRFTSMKSYENDLFKLYLISSVGPTKNEFMQHNPVTRNIISCEDVPSGVKGVPGVIGSLAWKVTSSVLRNRVQ